MEYIIYSKKSDNLYVMYFDQFTWCGAMYFGSVKMNFNRDYYIKKIAGNLDLEFIGPL